METEFILYVADQKKSKEFYEQVFEKAPALNVPGMTEFLLAPGIKLGLMPETGIAKIICPKMPLPSSGTGIPRCELYLKTDKAVIFYQNALKAGATLISEPAFRDWGDIVSYIADLDGHILAFAQ
jgi:lactoylglutathione lyase